MPASGKGEYLLEFHQVGNVVKVSALDTATNIEVSIVGDPAASQDELTRVAVQKLEYGLAKKARG